MDVFVRRRAGVQSRAIRRAENGLLMFVSLAWGEGKGESKPQPKNQTVGQSTCGGGSGCGGESTLWTLRCDSDPCLVCLAARDCAPPVRVLSKQHLDKHETLHIPLGPSGKFQLQTGGKCSRKKKTDIQSPPVGLVHHRLSSIPVPSIGRIYPSSQSWPLQLNLKVELTISFLFPWPYPIKVLSTIPAKYLLTDDKIGLALSSRRPR